MKLQVAAMVLWAGGAWAAGATSVQVTGMVAHPGNVALAGLKAVPVSASFQTMGGKQAHRWSGPLLLDVLAVASVTDEPGKKTHMRHVVLAKGADGYVAWVVS